MKPFVFRPRELLGHLTEGDVRFIVVGGIAVGAWGYVRGTKGLDIVPEPSTENLDRLASVLEALGGRVVVGEDLLAPSAIRIFLRSGDKALVRTEIGEVDVLQGIPQIPRFSELQRTATEAEVQGVVISVCSLGDLLGMKRAAGRPLDRIDIEALELGHGDASAGPDD